MANITSNIGGALKHYLAMFLLAFLASSGCLPFQGKSGKFVLPNKVQSRIREFD